MPVIQKPTLSEQEKQVEEALAAMHVTYVVHYFGPREESNPTASCGRTTSG